MGRVYDAASSRLRLEPPRVFPLVLTYDAATEPVRGQARASAAGRNQSLGDVEHDPALLGPCDPHGDHDREPVRTDPAEQHVRQARRSRRRAKVVDSGAGSACGRLLGFRRLRGQMTTRHLGRSPARQIGPYDQPFDRDLDRHA